MQENINEMDNVIILNDEDGNDIEMQFLDLIEYQNNEYVVFLPNEDGADEVVILRLEDNDDTENYYSVDDDNILKSVFSIFKERTKDLFDFI